MVQNALQKIIVLLIQVNYLVKIQEPMDLVFGMQILKNVHYFQLVKMLLIKINAIK